MQQEKQFKQSKNAILISYVIYRWILAAFTCGILTLHDWLNFRNTKLTFEKNFLVYVTGGFTTRSQEIPYEDIMSVNVDQSIIGQWFNYGTLNIVMKESRDLVAFKFIHDPETVRKSVQETYVRSMKMKMS